MDLQEIVDFGAEADGDGHGVNEFAGVFADTFGAEEKPGIRIGPEFDVAVFCLHEDRFAVIVKRIFCFDQAASLVLAFGDGRTGGGDLRIGENDECAILIADGRRILAESVICGEFSLEDGEVNDFEWSAHVTCGVDAGV